MVKAVHAGTWLHTFLSEGQAQKEIWCRALLLTGVSIFVVGMTLGRFFISLSTILCVVALAAMLLFPGPHGLAVARFPFRRLLLALIAWFAIKVVWSVSPGVGASPLFGALYKGFALLLAGMEIGKKRSLLPFMVFLFSFAAIFQGLDGIWQFYTGYDLIRGYPVLSGRLTGSLATYRVGNYIAMVMIPMLALPWLLPSRWKTWQKWLTLMLALVPPIFLLLFSQTRSGYICFTVALGALFALRGRFSRMLPLVIAVAAFFLLFHADRFSLASLMKDGRVELWGFAWEIFKAHPLTGSGLYTFNDAFHLLGLTPIRNVADISHPHNIYLQLLCETGIVGLALFSAFLLGVLVWSGKILRTKIREGGDPPYWIAAATFWAAGIGYAVMGITAHDLFRDWWFGLAWLQLGFLCGACMHEPSHAANSDTP